MPDVPSRSAAPLSGHEVQPGAGRVSLPRPLTSFVGREHELAQAKRLLQGSYLVTLTGPGGSGKTRLCIALAAEVARSGALAAELGLAPLGARPADARLPAPGPRGASSAGTGC
jgi:Mrp family chromosome partitioning ATPase